MLRAEPALPAAEAILEYQHPASPRVTHVRGTLVAGSRAGLKGLGRCDEYADLLAPAHKDTLLYCVASSWLALDATLAHFEACDRLALTHSEFEQIGRALAEQVTKTFLGAALRSTRSAGVDGHVRWALARMDRFMPRVYQGGRCAVLQHGPKHLVLELAGIPFAQSTYYRGVVLTQTKAIMGLFCRALFVKPARPRSPSPESFALALNWV